MLIGTTLVRRLLTTQFPQWADLPLAPVQQSGMDNATFRLGDDLSVRLPRYALDLAGFVNALRDIDPTGGPGPEQSNAFRGVGDDFGTLAVADPAVDLLPAYNFLPPRARDAFREAVGADTPHGPGRVAGPSRGRSRCPTTPASNRTRPASPGPSAIWSR
ncbi:hypothetical protein [Streptomyces sp. NBC_00019]|uniref:hypothetical protein n=1 Tax=Streptomyces sp. NBC_00019 TaxID=2975623 RepID=UPI00386B6323